MLIRTIRAIPSNFQDAVGAFPTPSMFNDNEIKKTGGAIQISKKILTM